MPTTPTPSSSSAVPLPSGCSPSDFRGPNYSGTASGAFSGCVVGIASVLQICCTSVGSTPAFVNQTCGCPIDPVLLPNAMDEFGKCAAGEYNATALCGVAISSGAAARWRWNGALVVLGVTVLVGLVGF